MKAIKIAASLVVLAISNAAFADIPIARGTYVDLNAGYSKIVSSDINADVSGLGFNVNVGYKFLPFFGIEAGYASYGASKSSFTGASAIDGAIKGILPFMEVGIELFAKLGADYVTNGKLPDGISKNATNVYYALGGAYAMSPGTLIVLQWSQAAGNSNTGNFQLLSIGVSYLF